MNKPTPLTRCFADLNSDDPITAQEASRSVEAAYRRGFQQALSFAGDALRARGNIEAASFLDSGCNLAGDMRFSRTPYPFFGDEWTIKMNKRRKVK